MEDNQNQSNISSLFSMFLTAGSTLVAIIAIIIKSPLLPSWVIYTFSFYLIILSIILLYKPLHYIFLKISEIRRNSLLKRLYYSKLKSILVKIKREINLQRDDNVFGTVFDLEGKGFHCIDVGDVNNLASMIEIVSERLAVSKDGNDLENITKTIDNLIFQYNTECLRIQENIEKLRIEATGNLQHPLRNHWQSFWQKWNIGVSNNRDFIKKWEELAIEINENLDKRIALAGFKLLPLGNDIPPFSFYAPDSIRQIPT